MPRTVCLFYVAQKCLFTPGKLRFRIFAGLESGVYGDSAGRKEAFFLTPQASIFVIRRCHYEKKHEPNMQAVPLNPIETRLPREIYSGKNGSTFAYFYRKYMCGGFAHTR
jgi:hypothetical protein